MTDPTSRFTHQLNNLAEQEAGLAQIVGQAGFFEQKAKQFANKDIFRRYAELYEAYVALVASENRAEKNEALKRALFLQWIGATEPPLLTGVNTLAVPTQFAVLEAVQNLVVEDGLDNEFRWMLDWYYRITDRYFESEISSSLDSLLAYLKSRNGEKHWVDGTDARPDPHMLHGRGQMSDYWLSILGS